MLDEGLPFAFGGLPACSASNAANDDAHLRGAGDAATAPPLKRQRTGAVARGHAPRRVAPAPLKRRKITSSAGAASALDGDEVIVSGPAAPVVASDGVRD